MAGDWGIITRGPYVAGPHVHERRSPMRDDTEMVARVALLGAIAWIAGCGGGEKSTGEDTSTDLVVDTQVDGLDVTTDVLPDVEEDIVSDVMTDPADDTAGETIEDTVSDTGEDIPGDVVVEEVAAGCGDGHVDTGEDCDDANEVNGDGCENDCTHSCELDSDCDDGDVCSGVETCDAASSYACVPGSFEVDGTLCDADGLSTTRDICLGGACGLSSCGDGYPDTEEGEECDDGNLLDGDGCENDCTYSAVTVTAYRIVSLDLVDPHLYTEVFACVDITSTANTEFQSSIDDMSLSFLNLFRPLDMSAATNMDEFVTSAQCTAGTPDSCTRDAADAPISTSAAISTSGSSVCLSADPTVLNVTYSDPSSPAGPCFVTDEETFNIDLGGILITLQNARVAAQFSAGSPPGTLIDGVIIGFLSTANAQAAVMPADLPLIGGDALYEHLADGRAPGSACDTAFGAWSVDDSDTLSSIPGFWFHMNFTAELVDWIDP